jgi:23S rRNA (cytidine1920-2'-O)/16S rRNA (cytidine1409-2'-O)-methyltransferase
MLVGGPLDRFLSTLVAQGYGKAGSTQNGWKRQDYQGMAKMRLDQLLVVRGLAESGEQARRYILAGLVEVEGVQRPKPGQQVREDVEVRVSQPERYVSRGALKLIEGLDRFGVEVAGRVALDLGASTGGFTQVLLERGAALVHAVDVGRSQMHWSLREDGRVRVHEEVNARFFDGGLLAGQAPGVVTADLLFISLTKVLPAVVPHGAPGADYVLLVKPQFEATRAEVSRGRGVVKDPAVWRRAIESVAGCAAQFGLSVVNICRSPIQGGSGNVEFLLHAKADGRGRRLAEIGISEAVDDGQDNVTGQS